MSDQRPDLLVPDKRLALPAGMATKETPIVSLQSVRETQAQNARDKEELNERVTKGWAKEMAARLAVELGQKMYDQFSGETVQFLEQMEHDIERRLYHGICARLDNERRARSFFGRFIRPLLLRLGAKEPPLALAAPKVSEQEIRAIEDAQEPAAEAPE